MKNTLLSLVTFLLLHTVLYSQDRIYFPDKLFYSKTAVQLTLSKGKFENGIQIYDGSSKRYYERLTDTIYRLYKEDSYDDFSNKFLIKRDDNILIFVEYIDLKNLENFRYCIASTDKRLLKNYKDTTVVRKEARLILNDLNQALIKSKLDYKTTLTNYLNRVEPGSTNAKTEGAISNWFLSLKKNFQIKKVLLMDSDFTIIYGDRNIPLYKKIPAIVIVKEAKTGMCYAYYSFFGYKYMGNDYSTDLQRYPTENHNYYIINDYIKYVPMKLRGDDYFEINCN